MSDAIGVSGSGMKSDSSGGGSREFARQAQVVRDDLRELGSLGKEAAKEFVGDAKRSAADTYKRGRESVSMAGDRFRGYVEENPMKSVLIAAAAGVILGAFWSRRR